MAPAPFRRRLAVVALTVACSGGVASGAGAVIGGSTIQVQAAPWAVLVVQNTGSSRYLCSGSIIDPSHVLTAAHCVYGDSGTLAQPSQLSIEAGVSNTAAPLPSDVEQDRSVSSVRVHPAYVWSGSSGPDDVAVLALSSPLDLSGPTAKAVALAPSGGSFPAGAAVGLAGFGRQDANAPPSGALQWMAGSADPQGSCGEPSSRGVIANDAISLCASSATSASCNGDSGAGLVTTGSTPTLVGVVSGGAAGCAPGSHTLYTYLGAPEVLAFVLGDDSPPSAPRESAATYVELRWPPPLVVGATLSCSSGDWGGPVSLAFAFLSGNGRVLASGSAASYVLRPTDVGASVYCQVAATSPGGTAIEQTTATTPVKPPPQMMLVALGPLKAVRGNLLSVRVSFRAPRGLQGRFGACLTPPARVGHRACTSLGRQQGGRGSFQFVLGFRVEPDAPLGSVRLVLRAFAGAANAQEAATLRISPAGR